MSLAQAIGKYGENIAAEYLKRKDYRILCQNYHSKFGEVDIVALSPDKCTVFVEVKTRRNTDYGDPSQFVTYSKQNKLRKTALCYTGTDQIYMRFDIVEVIYKIEGTKVKVASVNHIENAF